MNIDIKTLKVDTDKLNDDADGPRPTCNCSWMCHPETCGCPCHG